MQKKVLVFGTFDIFHDGHRHFLSEARKLADLLIVTLATDSVALNLKGHTPKNSYFERRSVLLKSGIVDEVIESDETIGTWDILSKVTPDIVAVGYDQADLYNSIVEYLNGKHSDISVIRITPFSNVKLHSSTIRND